MDIQEAVEEVRATEREYDGVCIQQSPDHTREVITAHVNFLSLPKTNLKEIKMEKLNNRFEEYLRTDVLKVQTDHEELWINSLTFYKKCMNDLGQLFKYLQVQFRSTTREDESMVVGAIIVEYMSTVLNSATDWKFEGKGQCLISKRSGKNIYMYKIVGVIFGPTLMSFNHRYMKLHLVTRKKNT